MKNICLQILDLKSSGTPLALATVVITHGSTPQKPGSSALFGEKGLISGTVGGGIVEGKVQQLAAEAIVNENSGLYHFNLANDISKTEEAICGGRISVLVETLMDKDFSVFEQLKRSLAGRIPGVLVTRVTLTGDKVISSDRFWMSEDVMPRVAGEVQKELELEVRKLISEKNPGGFAELECDTKDKDSAGTFFLQPFFPPDQLIIAGAGHIGRSLAHLGNLLDFEVTIIDDRPEFANTSNIPDAEHVIVRNIGEAMSGLETGENTYVVIVTRGHKDDAAALKSCFAKKLAYTGMIGSRNKIAAMRQKFIDDGWASADQWDKVHAPVGIQIKSQTVEEIAVSIAAELVMVRNKNR